jgi:hypothetical protein
MMQGDVPASDIIVGAVALVGFLGVAYVIGRTKSAFTNRTYARAWAPLVPVVNGTIVYDQSTAVSSSLHGQYKGHAVHAQMEPQRNRYHDSSTGRYNAFEVTLHDVAGAHDWRVYHDTKIFGIGRDGWQIDTDDAALASRLEASGITAVLAMLGTPTLKFDASAHTLLFSNDITPNLVLTVGDFVDVLELLLRMKAA